MRVVAVGPNPPLRQRALASAVATLLCAGGAQAQDALTERQGFAPFGRTEVTLSDNPNLSSSGSADAVARVTAGLGWRRSHGRIQGSASYALSGVLYANRSSSNTHQSQLNAEVDAEWWENKGFLNATAFIRQAPVSAFAAQPTEDGLPGVANARELRSLTLSPRWASTVGPFDFGLLGQTSIQDARGTDLGDGRSHSLTARIAPSVVRQLSWSVQGTTQRSEFDLSRAVRSNRASASVYWLWPSADMRVFAQAGRESANYLSQQMEASTTWATGVQWNPSRRTTLDAQIGERAFGRSHSLQAEYRTPRTVWRLFDSRDIAVGGDVPAFSRFGRLFDVLFAQFAAAYPDFADRAAAVDAYLRDNNLRADSVVAIGSLVSTSTISSRQGVSVGWRGPRSDIMATLSRSESRRADSGVVSAGDLSTSTWLRQHALTVLFTHRMGRSLVGTVTADMVRTVGDGGTLGGGERRTRQEGLRARVTGRITPRENWSLEARHTRFHVLDGSYNENALTASYSLQF